MIKSIFISGANGGIGSALCEAFTAKGYYVIASDKADEPTHNFCNAYQPLDLNRLISDTDYQAKVLVELAEYSPEVLINNAATQILGKIEEFSVEMWNTTMNVNLTSAFMLSKAFVASLTEQKGQILNIASIHANLTKPGFFAYATSKAALVGLTKSLAVEFKGRITVNSVSPAAIETEMLKEGFDYNQDKLDELAEIHPSQTLGSPKSLADFICTLVSSNNRFLNGSDIQYNGGIGGALLDLDY